MSIWLEYLRTKRFYSITLFEIIERLASSIFIRRNTFSSKWILSNVYHVSNILQLQRLWQSTETCYILQVPQKRLASTRLFMKINHGKVSIYLFPLIQLNDRYILFFCVPCHIYWNDIHNSNFIFQSLRSMHAEFANWNSSFSLLGIGIVQSFTQQVTISYH